MAEDLFATPGSEEIANAVMARRNAIALTRKFMADDPNSFYGLLDNLEDESAVIAQLCALVHGMVVLIAEGNEVSPRQVMDGLVSKLGEL